jgi:F0F1-type ATP synthase assembly protein I
VNSYLAIAAMLEALAGWLDDELAGGKPPKYLVHVAVGGALYVAEVARLEGMVRP